MIRSRAHCPLLRVGAAILPLVLLSLLAGACDRAILDPALTEGDDAALLRAAGLAQPEGRHTLSALVLEATREVRRSEGQAAARRLLEPVRRGQAEALEAARSDDGAALAAARERLRQAELAIALEVLGSGGVERVIAGVSDGLQTAAAVLDTVAGRPGDFAPLRAQQDEVVRALDTARLELAAGASLAALDAGTRAATHLVKLRRGILDMTRVHALPELYGRAERVLAAANGDVPGGAALLLRHAELKEAAHTAVAAGNREQAHAALTAVREEELRIVLQLLGPEVVTTVLQDVATALRDLQSGTRSAEPRLRRMLGAAADLQHRAATALTGGDAVAALDLASYAAGLINAYRLATTQL